MAGAPQPPPDAQNPRSTGAESSLWTFIVGLVFCYFGFYVAYSPLENSPPLYRYSVTAFTLMARVAGIGFLLVGVLALLRFRFADPLNLLLTGGSGIVCVAVALIWFMNGDGDGLLIGIVGLINMVSAFAMLNALRVNGTRREA